MNHILNCLKARRAWYRKALDMLLQIVPYEYSFPWPKGPGIGFCLEMPREMKEKYAQYMNGCIHELNNTIDMMEHSNK